MALLEYTYDFLTLTGSIVAANIGQNFADVASVLNGGIRSENIAPDAGIVSNQLACRFAPQETVFPLVPYVSDGTIAASPATFSTTATTGIPFNTRRIKVPTGKQKFLCSISIHAEQRTTQNFEVTVYRNGTLMAGSTFIFDSTDQYVEQENGDAWNTPFAAFVDDDELEYRVRATTSGAIIRGVVVTENWKTELVA
jgi:hypothetical protein